MYRVLERILLDSKLSSRCKQAIRLTGFWVGGADGRGVVEPAASVHALAADLAPEPLETSARPVQPRERVAPLQARHHLGGAPGAAEHPAATCRFNTPHNPPV